MPCCCCCCCCRAGSMWATNDDLLLVDVSVDDNVVVVSVVEGVLLALVNSSIVKREGVLSCCFADSSFTLPFLSSVAVCIPEANPPLKTIPGRPDP